MMRAFRPAALLIAMTAMLLGAMLPSGWMPSASGQMVMCGLSHDLPQPDHSQKPGDDGHGHDACPFAAAQHLAPPLAAPALGLPGRSHLALARPQPPLSAPSAPLYAPQSPRAPPAFA